MPRFAIKTLEFDKVKLMLGRKAATELGRRAAEDIGVSGDYEEIENWHEENAEFLKIFDSGRRLPFGGIFNIEELLKRAELGSVLEPGDFLQIGSTLAGIAAMQEFLQSVKEEVPRLAVYGDGLQIFSKLVKQINGTVDEHGEIKDYASPKLSGLRSGIQIAKNRVKQQLEDILHSSANQKFFQDAIVTIRGDRYVIPIKQEYRMNFPGIVHDQSSTGATLFIEPLSLVNLNNDIRRYVAEERQEVERILRQLTVNIGAEAAEIAKSLQLVTKLDVIAARGYLAVEQHAVRPQLLRQGGIRIQGGRHPLLQPDKVVPLTIELGGEYPMLLVTGPNTGGKTVAMKTVGLFALMNQAGLYLPALNAQMPVLTAVYADIGDEQSIEQSLSTFSAHMTKVIGILQEVQPGELVLFDELCAGTDPNEGAALAMSILTDLHERQVLTMITTHYSELKTFAYGHKGMRNASVEFDAESLMPTYRLLMGVPGSSNAFNISRRLGLSEKIVQAAGQMLKEEHVHMETVLQDLDAKRKNYEANQSEIAKLRFEAEMLRNQLAYQKREFMKHREEMLRHAKEQADEIYRNSRREAEAVLKELRSKKNEFDAKELREMAERARQQLNKQLSGDVEPPEGVPLTWKQAKVGQQVFVNKLGKIGKIISVNNVDITVQVGILKLNILAENCLLTKEQKRETPAKIGRRRVDTRHQMVMQKNLNVKQDVDLRGLLVEEAIPVIEKAIDDALLTGIGRLRIIHGKGTGALKAGVQEYLRKSASVVQMEDAANEEGGAGVTIVYL